MKKLKYGILLVLGVVTFQICARAQIASQQDSLRGVKSLAVVLEDFNADLEKDGITKAQVQTDVELRLRKAGLEVLKENDRRALQYLYVAVQAIRFHSGDTYACSIEVRFIQPVSIIRINRIAAGATWDRQYLGVYGVEKLSRIRQTVADLTDAFLNDYLAANDPLIVPPVLPPRKP